MTDTATPSPGTSLSFSQAHEQLSQLKRAIGQVLVGQESVVDGVLVALLAQGHVLLEGVPGLGKTLLVRCLAQLIAGDSRRIQFTPDLMPSDITGHAIYHMQQGSFEIRRGPVFTQLLLADEINRAPAKTQSALLEVMQERQVTIEGQSLAVPEPFMVLATQNPIEHEGTYPLPEAQLDRFLLHLRLDYPSEQEETNILRAQGAGQDPLASLTPCIDPQTVRRLQQLSQQVVLDDAVLAYLVQLVRATRQSPGIARGAGPRASLALAACARAQALCAGRDYVVPQDVKTLAPAVLRHRISLTPDALIDGLTNDQLIDQLLQRVPAPRH